MSQPPSHADWHALADRFDLGRIRGDASYVARGAMGQIWRLRTGAGDWAVKWQFPWAPTDARPADVPLQLAAAAAGIPLPLPVVAPDGAAVVRVRDEHARVYEWMDLGEPVPPPVPEAIAAEAGRLLGLLHGLAIHAAGPVDPWYTEVPGAGCWAGLAGQAAAAGVSWASRLAAAQPLIADLSKWAGPPSGRPAIACHRDFNPDNVLPAAGTGRLVVLDWENAGPLDPARELGYAVFTWCTGNGRFDRSAADALLAAYAQASGAAAAPGPGFFGTAVATHLNVLRVMAERALTEPDHRGSAEEFIASLLDHDLGDLRQVIKLWSQAPHSCQTGEE
jgi:aminoglycoside phosphotransferase (APT) family kinase protein